MSHCPAAQFSQAVLAGRRLAVLARDDVYQHRAVVRRRLGDVGQGQRPALPRKHRERLHRRAPT